MSINIPDLKKKIIYRATYRGTKEMDSLLIAFTKKYVHILNDEDLICLSNLLDVDDENLYNFKQGQNTTVKFINNKVNKLFRNFVYKKV